MRRPNKLATALNSWLTFEQMCKRESLFNESYLAYPIGQFLSSRYGAALVSEYPHPILTPLKEGRGDKPRIDFAVLGKDGNIELVIETKWLSSSRSLIRDIIRDLVRLELVVHAQGAEAWLILAGKGSYFDLISGNSKFKGHPSHIGSDPILPHGCSKSGRLRLNPPAKFRREILEDALRPFVGIELTDCIHITRFGPYPPDATPSGYVTYLWRVDKRKNTARFLPETIWNEFAQRRYSTER